MGDVDSTLETPSSGKSIGSGSSGDKELDAHNPFFIPNSDSTGHLHVSSVLTPTNYGEWVLEMTDALVTKNKIGFVDGSLPRPQGGGPSSLTWTRCDALVKGWLRSAMDPELRSSVMHAKTAQEILEDLRNRFSKGNLTRAYELRRHVSFLQQEKQSVSTFYTKLRKAWEETQSILSPPICACGRQCRDQNESLRLFDFLLGLDDSFATVRSQILSLSVPPSLPEAFRIVYNDEQQRLLTQTRKPLPEAAAFVTHGEADRGASGARNSRERSSADKEKDTRICTHCLKPGHLRETCYQLIGYPSCDKHGDGQNRRKSRDSGRDASCDGGAARGQGREPRASQVEQESSPVPGFSVQQLEQLKRFFGSQFSPATDPSSHMAGTFSSSDQCEWIIDSGCNEHITMDDNLLTTDHHVLSTPPVRISNGASIPVKRIGIVKLSDGMTLGRVLHVPEFCCNLLSVSRLCQEHHVAIIFLDDFCIVQDLHSRNVIGKGEIRDGLYFL
ncbi:unnamed protein product [Linum trigynum]|uniref:Retrotransposon Copia-like N-terminal domain-containing protein n=1 Tax=Linum trigynum TaxID=586398 RepID=A0AAV2CAD5_9ROSI